MKVNPHLRLCGPVGADNCPHLDTKLTPTHRGQARSPSPPDLHIPFDHIAHGSAQPAASLLMSEESRSSSNEVPGPLAQLAEQLTLNQQVLGSSPRRVTSIHPITKGLPTGGRPLTFTPEIAFC